MCWVIAVPSANRLGLLRHLVQLDRFIRRHKRLLCNRANRKPSAICVCDFKVRAVPKRRQINAQHQKPFLLSVYRPHVRELPRMTMIAGRQQHAIAKCHS
jgi:hypothetical protein